jgi:hypothetical protein
MWASEPAMPRLSLPVQSPILDGCVEPNCWKSSGDGAASALALGNDDARSTDKRLSWARLEEASCIALHTVYDGVNSFAH